MQINDTEARIVAQVEALRQELTRQGALSEGVRETLNALQTTIHDRYANGAGIGPRVIAMSNPKPSFLPTPEVLGAYGEALRKWSFRALLLVFGLVFAWKAATGDVIDSLQRLVWVFAPPETVQEIQSGEIPAGGLIDSTSTDAP